MQRQLGALIGMVMFLSGLASSAGSPPALAGSTTTTVEFGTLDSVARASNGDTVEISGAGAFSIHPKSVSGVADLITGAFGSVPRTFTLRDAAGQVVAQGTWEPSKVLSYRSFGPATADQNAQFGGLPDGSEGGKLRLKVALFVGGVRVHNGIITIGCELGQPPKNALDGTLMVVRGTGRNFNEAVSGDTIFLRHTS